jgi:hypothetical protein
MVSEYFKFSTRSKTMEHVADLKAFTRMVAAVKLHKNCYREDNKPVQALVPARTESL